MALLLHVGDSLSPTTLMAVALSIRTGERRLAHELSFRG